MMRTHRALARCLFGRQYSGHVSKALSAEIDLLTDEANAVHDSVSRSQFKENFEMVQQKIIRERDHDSMRKVMEIIQGNEQLEMRSLYNLTLQSCVKLSMIDEGEALFATMKAGKKRLQPNRFSFTTAMNLTKNNYDRCRALFDEMVENELQPDAYSFNTLVTSALRNDKVEEAMEYAAEMEKYSIPWTVHTYGALIHYYLKHNQAEQAWDYYKEMLDRGLEPPVAVRTSIIQFHLKHDNMEDAMAQFQDAKNATHPAGRPNRFTYSLLIDKFASKNDVENAQLLLDEARANEYVRLDRMPYTAVINMYGRTGNPDMAKQIYAALDDDGVGADARAMASLALVFHRAGDTESCHEMIQQVAQCNDRNKAKSLQFLKERFARFNDDDAIQVLDSYSS